MRQADQAILRTKAVLAAALEGDNAPEARPDHRRRGPRLEAVRRQAAADGRAIDPWHLAAVIEGIRFRMDRGAAMSGRLEEIWKTPRGLAGWFSTIDHKEIGKRYIVTAFIFLVLGGIEALVMRIQLARPDQQLLTPEQYNQLFSTHGITMIFLYALPILSGFSNYLWPLILGCRHAAKSRRPTTKHGDCPTTGHCSFL
jgi:hypothetical protein